VGEAGKPAALAVDGALTGICPAKTPSSTPWRLCVAERGKGRKTIVALAIAERLATAFMN
jgi:hypothetical protein